MDAETVVEIIEKEEEKPEQIIETEKKRNRAVGFALFAAAAGLALCRIGSHFLNKLFEGQGYQPWESEFVLDAIFIPVSQIIVCLLIPFLIYKLYQKRTVKQVFADANYRRVSWKILLCCIPLAIGCYFFTLFIVNWWLAQLIGLGYTYYPSSQLYPDVFNPALLLASLFLTAVLPAICEEFIMRGNFLTSLRHNYKNFGVVILASVAFGLFHQNVIQLVYTAIFGGLMAFLVIKTRSVLPAVILHFLNNAISTYMGYDGAYGWGVASGFDRVLSQFGAAYLLLIGGLGLIVGFTFLILKIAKKEKREEIPVLKLYKPSVRENAWHFGAIAVAAASTVITFVAGMIA